MTVAMRPILRLLRIGKQALEITNVLPSEQAGIGSHNDSKGIVVDPRLSFEITFYVAQPPSASFKSWERGLIVTLLILTDGLLLLLEMTYS